MRSKNLRFWTKIDTYLTNDSIACIFTIKVIMFWIEPHVSNYLNLKAALDLHVLAQILWGPSTYAHTYDLQRPNSACNKSTGGYVFRVDHPPAIEAGTGRSPNFRDDILPHRMTVSDRIR